MLNSNSHTSLRLTIVVLASLVLLMQACKSTESTANLDEESTTTPIDSLNNEQLELDDKNAQEIYETKKDSVFKILKAELYKEYETDANRLTTFYILAQQRFYGGEYEEALFLIDQAARIKTTPDILALKGSIYLGLGSIDDFVSNWREALSLDGNIPIPPAPAVVRELQRQGLINNNLERNF